MIKAFYPTTCPICHKILREKSLYVCKTCITKVTVIKEPRCKKCGKPLELKEIEYCYDCERNKHIFKQGIGVFVYDAVMQKSIAMWKYHGIRTYSEFYTTAMSTNAKSYVERWNIDVIIPVPIHAARYKKRGFNQAADLAVGLGRSLNLPVDLNFIQRIQNTKAQKTLDHSLRFKNMKEAFVVLKPQIGYKNILIVDDIYTTGSTIDAISATILQVQTVNIYFLTLSCGKGY